LEFGLFDQTQKKKEKDQPKKKPPPDEDGKSASTVHVGY
jgi:hypothetical protein